MRKNLMPKIRAFDLPNGLRSDISPAALARWDSSIYAAEDEASISIFDPIGADYLDGVTPKRISAALRSIGGKDVTVNINSPGGSLSEGVTIYSLLREYKGDVTVRVLGMAASAASIIAMAGDDIQIARAGEMMIHNCWVVAIGNRNDLREFADDLEPRDIAMAEIYADRSGLELKKIQKMMDTETRIGGAEAVEMGFANSLLPSDTKTTARAETKAQSALRWLDITLAKQGIPRAERRERFSQLMDGTPSAAEHDDTPSAIDDRTSMPSAAEDDKPSAVVLPQLAGYLVSVIEGFSLPA